jgi:ABC-2 type transport system permease protein
MRRSANILAIARREFTIRVGTRSFLIGTALLVIGVVAMAFLPVLIGKIDSIDATKLAVMAPEKTLAARAQATISTLLNPDPTGQASGSTTGAQPDFVVAVVPDLAAARAEVVRGSYSGVLGITRGGDGSIQFTYYSNDSTAGRTTSLLRQAANAIAVGDRLDRLAIPTDQQATLFAPAAFAVDWASPERTDPILSGASAAGQDMLAFGMTILIFMIVIMYGNWVAMSVVEEKSSRVMEVVLNAATPFQLLAGKVLGVGSVAFIQYAAVVVAGIVALVAQPAVGSAVLGSAASTAGITQGLSPTLLLLFGAFGLLGFLLYASLYAAAGSLVSRQEDVNAAVMPMTLISMAGYLIGVYASMGLLDARSGWVTGLSFVPFLSPFMMLGRVSTGVAEPWEVAHALVLLGVAIGLAIWVAARIYAVGVLLYGQRPGTRAVWRLLREGM